VGDRKLSEYLHAMADYWHRRALVASDPNAQSRHEEMERDALLYARNAAALEAENEKLRARAALAEARLAALNEQGFIHRDNRRKLWSTFFAVGETLEECADSEIAAALTVDAMIAERGRAATGPETSDGRA